MLEVLAKDEDGRVRENVPSNENCPIELLELLGEDELCQKAVGRNSNFWVDLLETLSGEPDFGEAVASNPNCPGELLDIWAEQRDEYARYATAANPNCPPSALSASWA